MKPGPAALKLSVLLAHGGRRCPAARARGQVGAGSRRSARRAQTPPCWWRAGGLNPIRKRISTCIGHACPGKALELARSERRASGGFWWAHSPLGPPRIDPKKRFIVAHLARGCSRARCSTSRELRAAAAAAAISVS